jgi:uncharacterized membrane protein YgdD (TMEM256/DUF423 family)
MVARIAERSYRKSSLAVVAWLFVAGTILFSGSLYVLSISAMRWVGVFTPLGGAAWIAGWALLAWTAATSRP